MMSSMHVVIDFAMTCYVDRLPRDWIFRALSVHLGPYAMCPPHRAPGGYARPSHFELVRGH
jgi:hypothetical protein